MPLTSPETLLERCERLQRENDQLRRTNKALIATVAELQREFRHMARNEVTP